MNIYLSPIVSDKRQTIKFNDEIIQIAVDNTVYEYDFSNLVDGKMTSPTEHVLSAKREDGELSVEIINYIGANATEEEKFPQWQVVKRSDELNYNAQVLPIEWITKQELDEIVNAPKPPTEIELLKNKIATQDQVIEELMFIIIPEITGGGI